MRICIFGSEIGLVKKKVFVGGSIVSAVRLGQALHALGDEVFVLSSAPRGKPSGNYSFEWGTIVNRRIHGRYMSFLYLFLYGFFSFFGLLRFCRRNRIEIISIHSGSFLLCVIPGFVGKILHIPVVHTQYCDMIVPHGSLGRFFGRSLVRECSRLLAKFCGISANVCAFLVQAGVPSQKVELIPPVIPRQEQNEPT